MIKNEHGQEVHLTVRQKQKIKKAIRNGNTSIIKKILGSNVVYGIPTNLLEQKELGLQKLTEPKPEQKIATEIGPQRGLTDTAPRKQKTAVIPDFQWANPQPYNPLPPPAIEPQPPANKAPVSRPIGVADLKSDSDSTDGEDGDFKIYWEGVEYNVVGGQNGDALLRPKKGGGPSIKF
ncbi:hypothetical protein ABW21_db0207110 [Orbilia brochopaga]|nr:hypothetical protein ABW21_db0207110 [Drechslerella brochopaga]